MTLRPGLLLLLAVSLPAAASAAPNCARQTSEVRALETRWLDTYRNRDPAAMGEILAHDFSITHTDGSVQRREDVLGELTRRQGSPGPAFFTTGVDARCRRGLVVLTGWVARQGAEETSRARYTDTWVREGGRWKVLSSHLSRPPRPK